MTLEARRRRAGFPAVSSPSDKASRPSRAHAIEAMPAGCRLFSGAPRLATPILASPPRMLMKRWREPLHGIVARNVKLTDSYRDAISRHL